MRNYREETVAVLAENLAEKAADINLPVTECFRIAHKYATENGIADPDYAAMIRMLNYGFTMGLEYCKKL